MLMASFNARPGVLPNIMWIMDWIFKLTNFGIVSIIHQDFFILSVSLNVYGHNVKFQTSFDISLLYRNCVHLQGRKQREQGIQDLRIHLRESYIPRNRKLMVLFPEGGFLRKRREASQRYCLSPEFLLRLKITSYYFGETMIFFLLFLFCRIFITTFIVKFSG